ncbi:zinc-ribbon domain-containing protein [Olsenella sp. KH3B4]|nr:zinc-ribbon domain-containing protein [Olsenella sp. KH3B4]
MFCPKCGVENPDGAKFCKGCGSPLGGQPTNSPFAGTPAPGVTPVPAPKPQKKPKLPVIIAAVAIVAVLVVGFATSWFGLVGHSLPNGVYTLHEADGGDTLYSVHSDGISSLSTGWVYYEGKTEVKRSGDHQIVSLSDTHSNESSNYSSIEFSFALPSKFGNGSYAGDYGVYVSVTQNGDSKPREALLWAQLKDDGTAVFKEYTSSSTDGPDCSAIFNSISSGSWSDDQATQGTWRKNDSSEGITVYDKNGNIETTVTFDPYK